MSPNRRLAYIDNYEMRVADWEFSREQDFSPPGFRVARDPYPFKDHVRRWIYPVAIPLLALLLRRRFAVPGIPREWTLVWGARGQGGRYMVSRVNHARRIRGADVLLLGVGLGREIEFWAPYRPRRILGVDILNFREAWEVLKHGYKSLNLDFLQAPADSLADLADASFDIITTENVFEHVKDLPALIAECKRVLRPGGVLFTTFGPLWYSWSGDHFSGEIEGGHGFLHLVGNLEDYKAWTREFAFREGQRADGRVWLLQDLFSYLRPKQYVECCGRCFTVTDVRAHLSPQAWDFRQKRPEEFAEICRRHGLADWEPIVAGLEILAFNAPSRSLPT